MAGSRLEQLVEYRPSFVTWILAALCSFLTMCITLAAEHFSSIALGFSIAGVTLVAGPVVACCPIQRCNDCSGNLNKVICIIAIFYLVLLLIETTGFVVPLGIHVAAAYLFVKETYKLTSDETLDKGPIVAAAVFSVLAALAVAVMALFWFCRTRSSGDWCECDWCECGWMRKRSSRTEAEREQEERKRQEEREEFDRLEENALLEPQEEPELEKQRLWLYGDRTDQAKGSNLPSYSTIPSTS